MNRKRRVLFFAEAVTLAHVARPLVLAAALDKDQYDVCIACAPRYENLVRATGAAYLPLDSISTEQFLWRLARGSPIYSVRTLHSYIEADTNAMALFRPDLVVGDFRISLSVSARLMGVQYLTVTNAYWSPYARPHFTVPEIPLVGMLGPKAAQFLFDIVRPLAFAYHSLPLNLVRRAHGMRTLGWGLRRTYTDADYMLYADLEELVPIKHADTQLGHRAYRYIGPVLWSFPAPMPEWWDRLPPDIPVVYVTLGSSGRYDLLELVLHALSELPLIVIASTAGRGEMRALPGNVYVSDFIAGDEATKRSSLVICNGGSLTTYQALAMSVPVLGIANNMDQLLNMSYVAATGAGTLLRAGEVTKRSLLSAVKKLLYYPKAADAARQLAERIGKVSCHRSFRTAIEECQ